MRCAAYLAGLLGIFLVGLSALFGALRHSNPQLYQLIYGADGLYKLYPVSSKVEALSPHLHLIYNTPAISPNGEMAVFSATQACHSELFLWSLATATSTSLLLDPAPCPSESSGPYYASPHWSPRGDALLFSVQPAFSTNRYLNPDNYRPPPIIMHFDLSTATSTALTDYQSTDPAWSSNGQWLTFVKWTSATTTELIKMQFATRQTKTLLRGGGIYGESLWSPDDKWLYFRYYDATAWAIYRVASAGGTPQKLLTARNYAGDLSLSPSGDWLLFISDHDGDREVYKMRPDGSHLQQLTANHIDESRPRFSPDGKWIVYASYPTHQRGIYLMQADGSQKRYLDSTPSTDWFPNWLNFPQKAWDATSLWLIICFLGLLVLFFYRLAPFLQKRRTI